jgi:hypothetical protein
MVEETQLPNDPWMQNGGPAFPIEADGIIYKGLELRDYFAVHSMTAVLAIMPPDYDAAALMAYAFADALLAARAQQPPAQDVREGGE